MYQRYEFKADVWTVASSLEEAISNLNELAGIVQHTSCGISIENEPSKTEPEDDWNNDEEAA